MQSFSWLTLWTNKYLTLSKEPNSKNLLVRRHMSGQGLSEFMWHWIILVVMNQKKEELEEEEKGCLVASVID